MQSLFLGGQRTQAALRLWLQPLRLTFASRTSAYALVRLSRSISAYAEWLWMDSKFSASTT